MFWGETSGRVPGSVPYGRRSVKGAEEEQAVPLRIIVEEGVPGKGPAICQFRLSGAAGLGASP